jgi:hypothetical protein
MKLMQSFGLIQGDMERGEIPIDSMVGASGYPEVTFAERPGQTTAVVESSLPNGDDVTISIVPFLMD